MGIARSSCVITAFLLASASMSAEAQNASATHKLHISVADSATGTALAGAQVFLAGNERAFIVPESGIVTLELAAPARDTITVRRLGYRPVTIAVSLMPAATTSLAFTLDPAPYALPEVSIESSMSAALTRNGFYDRRMRTGGFFVGPDEIDRQRPARLSDLLAGDPQIRFSPAASGGRNIRFARAKDCPPLVYVDGVLLVNELGVSRIRPFLRGTQRSREGSDDFFSQQDQGIDEISVRQVAAIEAYASVTQAPPQYSANGAVCGILFVWTTSFLAHTH